MVVLAALTVIRALAVQVSDLGSGFLVTSQSFSHSFFNFAPEHDLQDMYIQVHCACALVYRKCLS